MLFSVGKLPQKEIVYFGVVQLFQYSLYKYIDLQPL